MKYDPLERLYNHNYGLSNCVRRKALDDAALTSVKLAAQEHRVSVGTIYKWRRHVGAYETGYNDAVVEMKGVK
jgi:hypothetical protein